MPSFLSRLPRLRWWALAGLALGIGALVDYQRWDARGAFWLQEQRLSVAQQQARVWLPGYRAVLQGKPLAGLEKGETSGLSYSPATDTLFTVTGKYPELVELSLDGEVLRRIALSGFSNPEGVEVLDAGRLGIIDERQHRLVVFDLDDSTLSLDARDFPSFELGFVDAGNKGFEGIAWDSRNQQVLLGKERDPLGLFSLRLSTAEGSGATLQPLPSEQLFVRDIASISYDARTGNLLVLSDESRLLLEVDAQGTPLSFLSLSGGMNGLRRGIKQPEGVTMDAAGTLYIVAEPNLFYVFKKTAE